MTRKRRDHREDASELGKAVLRIVLSLVIGSCASRTQPGTGIPAAGAPPTSAPIAPPLAPGVGSATAGAIEALLAAGLTREDLAALTPGPPRALTGGILFTFADRSAQSVFVAGTFNGWVPNQHGLERRGVADSLWVGLVPRPPRGRYLYKFLLDGRRWVVDPANAERGRDGGGGTASVAVVP